MLWQLLLDPALLALSQARHLLLRQQCDAQIHRKAASCAAPSSRQRRGACSIREAGRGRVEQLASWPTWCTCAAGLTCRSRWDHRWPLEESLTADAAHRDGCACWEKRFEPGLRSMAANCSHHGVQEMGAGDERVAAGSQ